ncbi:hypothetical protein AAVH_33020 [Aphelenchoides avenae]|nr:hypothetical protein AAVH_33020 [Aphelenchus avenae]
MDQRLTVKSRKSDVCLRAVCVLLWLAYAGLIGLYVFVVDLNWRPFLRSPWSGWISACLAAHIWTTILAFVNASFFKSSSLYGVLLVVQIPCYFGIANVAMPLAAISRDLFLTGADACYHTHESCSMAVEHGGLLVALTVLALLELTFFVLLAAGCTSVRKSKRPNRDPGLVVGLPPAVPK